MGVQLFFIGPNESVSSRSFEQTSAPHPVYRATAGLRPRKCDISVLYNTTQSLDDPRNDTTRSDPQRVGMCSGERPIGAAKGKQTNTMASCHPPLADPEAHLTASDAWEPPPLKGQGGTHPPDPHPPDLKCRCASRTEAPPTSLCIPRLRQRLRAAVGLGLSSFSLRGSCAHMRQTWRRISPTLTGRLLPPRVPGRARTTGIGGLGPGGRPCLHRPHHRRRSRRQHRQSRQRLRRRQDLQGPRFPIRCHVPTTQVPPPFKAAAPIAVRL